MAQPKQIRLQIGLNMWRRIARTVCAAAGAVLTLLALGAPVQACRGPTFERRILLDSVPPVAQGSDVIARVEILDVHVLELSVHTGVRVARARVLQSIRGVADGDIIEIHAQPTSCGGGLDQSAVGRQGFIAGRFDEFGGGSIFRGTWTNREIGKLER